MAERSYLDTIETPVDSRRAKLAGSVADQIVADVIELGWPVGEVIGSEADLVARYGISRAVFREAARIVEHQHVAQMRRGPGGGLVVTEPDIDAVISAAVLYLLRVDARLDEIFEARVVLEEIVAEVVPDRLSEADIASIREILAAEAAGTQHDQRRLHAMLATVSRNPVLDLFVEALNRLALAYFSDPAALTPTALGESAHAHSQIAHAIIGNDPGLARRRMRRHLRAEADYIREKAATSQALDPAVALNGALGSKRSEAVARSIFTDVITVPLAPGTFVGSESDLMEKHGASRAVLREAVRILEHHHVVLMRRGPRGGLFVTAPNVAAVSDIVTIYLRRHGVTPAHLAEVRMGIELAIVERVGSSLSDTARDRIRAAIGSETELGYPRSFSRGADLHTVLASLSGNRALELVGRIVLLTAGAIFTNNTRDRISRAELDLVEEAHRGIGEALVGGDADLAQRRMRQHLTEMDPATSSH